MSTLARRSGVDAARLESKIVAAKSLTDKLKSGSSVPVADNTLSEGHSSLETRSHASAPAASRPESPQRPQVAPSHGSAFAHAVA